MPEQVRSTECPSEPQASGLTDLLAVKLPPEINVQLLQQNWHPLPAPFFLLLTQHRQDALDKRNIDSIFHRIIALPEAPLHQDECGKDFVFIFLPYCLGCFDFELAHLQVKKTFVFFECLFQFGIQSQGFFFELLLDIHPLYR